VIDMAGPNKFADGGIMYALAAVTACAALLALVLGAFSALRGRPLTIGRLRAKRTGQDNTRRYGLAQVLSSAGILIVGLQPFLILTWLSRTVLLSVAVVLTIAGAVWTTAMLLRGGTRNA
jgi:hypothetical protein